ncbi:cystin-1 [Vipera latastei]
MARVPEVALGALYVGTRTVATAPILTSSPPGGESLPGVAHAKLCSQGHDLSAEIQKPPKRTTKALGQGKGTRIDPTLFGHRPPGSRNCWALESEPSGKQSGAAKRLRASCNRPESQDTPAAMGTGSSRAGKARTFSPPRHWRDPGPGSSSHSTPSRQGLADHEEEACVRAAVQALSRAPSLQQLQQPDSDSELLDQVLEECEEDGPQLLPTAAPRRPPRHGSGDCRSRPPEVGGEETAGQREALESFLTRSTPGSNNFANQLPLKKAERQAKISYDCSEEELMATIEQEYCR